MSFARAWRLGHGAAESRRAPPHVDRRSQVAAVLALQRSVGNRRTGALLRSPDPSAPEFAPLSSALTKGGLDAQAWKEKVVDAKQALAERKIDDATRLYVELYQDLARTAGAEVLADVSDKYPINIAKADDTAHKPGLNLVLGSGGSKGGKTAFVDSGGNFGVRLGLSAGTGQPHVAIRLYSGSFSEDKAMSLDILRHEMTHAKHAQRGLESVGRWLKAGGKGSADKFEDWLKRNRKGLSDADVALIKETARGGSANTEVLAYTEGFMTAFHLIDPPPPVDHPVFAELLGVLETTKVLPWVSADSHVRDQAVQRLQRYYCDVLDAGHRQAFDAWVSAQVTRAESDEAVLKANNDPGRVASARARQGNGYGPFVKRLAQISGKCKTGKASGGR